MKLSHGARRCLNVLRTYGTSVFPKQETLAGRLLCDIRSVRRYVQELKQAGLVTVRKRGATSSIYQLLVPPSSPKPKRSWAGRPHPKDPAWIALRFVVLKRDRFTCQYCGRKSPEVSLEVDHVIPVSKGGPTEMANLRTACYTCNRGKGVMSL